MSNFICLNGEDLTVLESGPENEEYQDTLDRLGISQEEADNIVNWSPQEPEQFIQ